MAAAPILVADPDEPDRALVGSVLARGGFRPVLAASGEDALALAFAEQPQLAVLEVRLGDMSGYEVCRELRETLGPAVGIVFVSGDRTEPSDRVAGLMLGADDYLAKPVMGDELLARVRAVVRRTAVSGPLPLAVGDALTPREREVLELLADGLDQRDIAARLFIAHKTVGKHIEHILRKLSAPNRAAAVAIAYQRGLVPVQQLQRAS
ncbi:MAG TPA: response regulator transcription factor [Polyangiales bacterium]|nr:response regulator transcription factor [Polyangiales bacterium]